MLILLGSVMVKDWFPVPVAVNEAAAPDPPPDVTPDSVRVPSVGLTTTVPALEPGTMAPKDRGVVLTRERLVMMVAEALALADWAKATGVARRRAPVMMCAVNFIVCSLR